MSEVSQPTTFRALMKKGQRDRSSVVGAPDSFDLVKSLRVAKRISVAIAFGHMSGWGVIGDSIAQSTASCTRILLGTAFFQTEPDLLLLLLELSKSRPMIEVRLASSQSTFHPKVWIVEGSDCSISIVGSGNLSGGGLIKNVECSTYSEAPSNILALDAWFDEHWRRAIKLSDGFASYARKYEELKQLRSDFDARMKQATAEIEDGEGQLQESAAVIDAKSYWTSETGKKEIAAREESLNSMRKVLDFPNFNFDEGSFRQFILTDEFGYIVRIHVNKIIAELTAVKKALRIYLEDPDKGFDAFMNVPGIGNNIATKLAVTCDSGDSVVYNSRVKSALSVFGISTKNFDHLSSSTYRDFIRSVKTFSEASDALGLNKASALDAFFYKYSDVGIG